MARIIVRVKKFGDSTMIILDRKIRNEMNINVGDTVIADITKVLPEQLDRIVALAELESQEEK